MNRIGVKLGCEPEDAVPLNAAFIDDMININILKSREIEEATSRSDY